MFGLLEFGSVVGSLEQRVESEFGCVAGARPKSVPGSCRRRFPSMESM